jgi:hypothetical protein
MCDDHRIGIVFLNQSVHIAEYGRFSCRRLRDAGIAQMNRFWVLGAYCDRGPSCATCQPDGSDGP